jgi:hypothetical protein
MKQTIAAQAGESVEVGSLSRLQRGLTAQIYIGPVTETVQQYQYTFRRH